MSEQKENTWIDQSPEAEPDRKLQREVLGELVFELGAKKSRSGSPIFSRRVSMNLE